MALPKGREARTFYRSARERLTDARVLLDADRTTGATYLAGYCVECILKALTLSTLPEKRRSQALLGFRGLRGHDLRRLHQQYRAAGGATPPQEIIAALSGLDVWGTHLRYEAATTDGRTARAAIEAADRVIRWAEGRL